MCGSRKYPHLHHRGNNWKFCRGEWVGVKDPRNSGGEGMDSRFSFQGRVVPSPIKITQD